MTTECNQVTFEFHGLLQRKVKARFDGGKITSDAGVLLLREVEKRTGLVGGLAECFSDHRDPRLIEHTVKELLAQRVYGLCLGYEDLNDHDQLRTDPMLAVAVEKADPLGENRRQAGDRGKALAGKCTLNRFELTGAEVDAQERYKKIVMDGNKIDHWMVDAFLAAHESAPDEIVLDLDATDDTIHGHQEGRFYHGYYGNYCYLPLYIFAGEHLLCARLRRSNISTPALSLLGRLHAHARLAPSGTPEHRSGTRSVRNDPLEAPQDRSSSPPDRSSHLGLHVGSLSLRRHLRPRCSKSTSASSALLTDTAPTFDLLRSPRPRSASVRPVTLS